MVLETKLQRSELTENGHVSYFELGSMERIVVTSCQISDEKQPQLSESPLWEIVSVVLVITLWLYQRPARIWHSIYVRICLSRMM